jgi:hypothetical protein
MNTGAECNLRNAVFYIKDKENDKMQMCYSYLNLCQMLFSNYKEDIPPREDYSR